MTNPFASSVGLKGVTSPEPTVLVNDLPGISTELVSALKNADATNALQVWQKVQRNGLDKLSNIIEAELSKSADFKYELVRSGLATGTTTEPIEIDDSYVGIHITAPYDRYRETYIESVSMTAKADGNLQLIVWDRGANAPNRILLEKTVTVVTGYNLIPVELAVRMKYGQDADLFIGFDNAALLLEPVGVSQGWETTDSRYTMKPCYMFGGIIGTPYPLALMLNASVRNDLSSVIARYSDRLLWAYANVCGSLLMAEKLGSSNVNLFTNTNRNYSADLEAKFMDEAVILAKPVARDMLKELVTTGTVTDARDRPFDAGYTSGSFV